MDRPGLGPGASGKTGFGNGALYDAARPVCPDDAIQHFAAVLRLNSTIHVLGLGAGSGIFSRPVRPLVGRVTSVEPSASMRESFQSANSDMEILDGSDVSIPIDDDSVDAVFVAQAFHWFDASRALNEIHHVLVPYGALGLIWNERYETVEWVSALSRAVQCDARQPYEVGKDFTDVISERPFVSVVNLLFALTQNHVVATAVEPSFIPFVWYSDGVRTTIDKAGRLVVPKVLRDRLGLHSGEVEITADGASLRVKPVFDDSLVEKDGRLVIPSSDATITDEFVRELRDADEK
ncbi:MAG: methyltransferase domain-containing protein [Acidimicrobiales bacterium]